MKILVAYDGFERSAFALEEAARIALHEGAGRHGVTGPAEVVVLSVVPPAEMTPSPGAPVGMRPHAIDDVALGHRFLRERGIESEMKIAYGDPAEEILKEATERRCDVVVLGTRGLGPVGKLLLGSVSQKVAERAPCTVTIAAKGRTERVEPVARAS